MSSLRAMTPGRRWYAQYLQSAHWVATREAAIARAGFCCEFCGYQPLLEWEIDYELSAHHLTYERCPGRELPADLIVLCRDCHADAHEAPRLKEAIRGFAARRRPDEIEGVAV